MRLSASCLALLGVASTRAAFVPQCNTVRPRVALKGYLDDLTAELYAEEDSPDVEANTQEATKLAKDKIENAGVGSWEGFVDFDEFDGGDGQMGVAGDGNKGLEKIGEGSTPELAKSKSMSAKNAWGTSTGYADQLLQQNPTMDVARAQQLENWQNQQEVKNRQNQMKSMTESFDEVSHSDEENWRSLAKFGVERNQDFDLDSAFGEVQAGPEIEGTFELRSEMGRIEATQFEVRNDYMGFADFRASFTPETPPDWTVEPKEGSLSSREATKFTLKFRPNNPGSSEGYLVVETEDFKKTWKLIGST